MNSADTLITSLTALVDCRALHIHYLRGARALCNVGLTGLTLMLLSAILAGLLLTTLVWVDSHTWIYIRKRFVFKIMSLMIQCFLFCFVFISTGRTIIK